MYLKPTLKPNSTIAGSTRINAKKRQKEKMSGNSDENERDQGAQWAKPPTPTRAIDAFKWEKNRRKKKREEIWSGLPAEFPWTIWLPLTTHIDHSVDLF